MRWQFLGFFSALVLTSALAPSHVAAICVAADPVVSMDVQDAPPGCATIEARATGGDSFLEVVNQCDVELRVERVNCSTCGDDVFTATAGETGQLKVATGYHGEPAQSDYRWSTPEASGVLTVTAHMPETEPCNDVRYSYANDPSCATAAHERGALPASFAMLVLLALGARLRRSHAS